MKVKNIMFSGVMAAILGATGANAAINVASQGYVDEKVDAVATSVSTLETNVASTYLTQEDAADTYLTETQVQQEIKDVVGDSTSGVVADVAKNTAAIAALDDKYATDAALNTAKEDLQGAIDAEALARGQADTRLDSRLQELEKFSGEGEGSVAKQIADAVAGEASLRDAADTALQTQITANATGVSEAKSAAAKALTDAKAYTDSEVGKVDAKLADYTKTSDLDTTFATDAELGAVDAKFANYTTTEGLTTKLSEYAKQADLTAEVTARETAVKAVDDKLADYTKTADLDKGFVSESEMTTFKTENTDAINAKVAQSDYNTKVAALEAKDAELAGGVSENASAIDAIEAAYIAKPAACQNTYCVLSVNGDTISWMPLTEPVSAFNK